MSLVGARRRQRSRGRIFALQVGQAVLREVLGPVEGHRQVADLTVATSGVAWPPAREGREESESMAKIPKSAKFRRLVLGNTEADLSK